MRRSASRVRWRCGVELTRSPTGPPSFSFAADADADDFFAAVEALAFVLNVALTEVASRALRLPAPVVRVPVTSLVYFGVSMPLWRRVFASEEVAS